MQQQLVLDPIAISISDTCRALGLSRYTISRLVKAGVIRSRKIGRRVLICSKSVREFISP
jgi:excisionase family DNA binding protein